MPVNVIDTLKPKNGLNFPVVEAIDVFVEDYENLADAISHFATDVMIEAINTVLSGKAEASDLAALEVEVNTKADASALTTAAANLQAQIDNLITPVTQDAEVQNARVGAEGIAYTTLKERLDNDYSDLENQIITLGEGFKITHYDWTQGGYDPQTEQYISSTSWKRVLTPLDKPILIELNSDTSMQVFAGTLEDGNFLYSSAISQQIGYRDTVTGGSRIISYDERTDIYVIIQIRKGWTDTTQISAEALMHSFIESELAEDVTSLEKEVTFDKSKQIDLSANTSYATEIALTVDSINNTGNIVAGKTDGYGSNVNYSTSGWYFCAEGDKITYILPAETGTKTLQTVDKDGNVVTEISGTGQTDTHTEQTHTFLENEFAFRVCVYTGLKPVARLSYESVNAAVLKSTLSDLSYAIDMTHKVIDNDYRTQRIRFLQGALYDPYQTITPVLNRAVSDFIDISSKKDLTLSCTNGYEFTIYCYNSDKEYLLKYTPSTLPYYSPYPAIKYVRIVVLKSDNTNITPSEAEINFTMNFTEISCETNLIDLSRNNESIDRTILDELDGYDISAGINHVKSNKMTSSIRRCYTGDIVKYRLAQETPAYMFVTYDKDMNMVYSKKGDGTNNYNTLYSHTFTDQEYYFQLSCWKATYRFASIEYFSKYGKLANPYASFSDETDSAVEKLKAHYTCNNQLVFGFNTDQHASAKLSAGDSESVYNGLRELSKITNIYPFNFVCLGGDAPSYNSRTVQTICDDILAVKKSAMGADCPVISICGNHDAYDNTTDITLRQLYNVHFKDAIQKNEIVPVDNFSTTGYIDFVSESIRAIFIDSNFRGSYNIDTARGYLADMLDNLPEGYKAVILSHYPLNTGMNTPPFDSKVDFNSVIETHSSDILFCVNGHAHVDSEDVVNGILYVQTTTAGKDGMSAFPQERIRDTADDTAYDIYVANLDDGVVDIIRYGSGKDRKLYYSGTLASFTFNLPENVTVSSKPHALYAGSDYHAFFKTSDEISVVITMNGVDITNSAYNPNTRSIDIIDISGNVIISVEIAS